MNQITAPDSLWLNLRVYIDGLVISEGLVQNTLMNNAEAVPVRYPQEDSDS